MLRDRVQAGLSMPAFLELPHENRELWHAVHDHARVSEAQVARALALGGPWHLLVLNEPWCGDAVNTLPVFARLVEHLPGWTMRIVSRDANPDLMDAHLTGTSRSIPVVIVLDGDFVERGWWGPRPQALQTWALGPAARAMAKEDRYREMRRWYARDRGVTAVDELLTVLERARAADLVPAREAPAPIARPDRGSQ